MSYCPETEKIRALRSGNLTDEEALALRNHTGQCPACRQEMLVEDEIERELEREIIAPEIERSVIRELMILRLAESEKPTRRLYRYLTLSVLTMILGFLVIPYLIQLPAMRLGQLFAPERLIPFVTFLKSNPLVTIAIGNVLIATCLAVWYPRFRRVFTI